MGKTGSKGLCEPSKLEDENEHTLESSIANYLYYDIFNGCHSNQIEKYIDWEISNHAYASSIPRIVFFSF